MFTKIWPRLLGMLPSLILCAAAIAIYVMGFSTGKRFGELNGSVALTKQKLEHLASQNAANELLVAKLKTAQKESDAWQAKTQQTSKTLAEANQTIQRQAAETKKGIQDAIAKDKSAADGKCIDGLGANGLRQYNQAFGYTH